MMRVMSLTMCLILPMAAFAQDPAVTPPPEVTAVPESKPTADQPTQAALTPTDVAGNGATEGTRACGMYGGCAGRGHGKAKLIVLTGVIGTIVTAAAVGIAVGVARSQANNGQIPR